ncbi:hypothetical protein [Nonomuraea sp. KM88]|uniref:hypothetical protein n=1 Tax=Nonomuraea sp. KM88 TaxID=3457427 RepID=UPI003FCD6820
MSDLRAGLAYLLTTPWLVGTLALACHGLGGVIGSLTMSALTLPRRYLSVMLPTWGGGCLPLGRVSSLAFFVSLSAAPLSMALVGPAAAAWGSQPVFLVAAVAPLTVAVLAIALARLRRDEIDHPLTPAR